MEKYTGMKSAMKRKEMDDQVEDDFPLSSPAYKIRRLDAELPPVVEEEDGDLSRRFEQVIPESVILSVVGNPSKTPDLEELPDSVPENEERAIVLFKPMNNMLPFAATNFSVDPNFIASFKNKALWGVDINTGEHREKQEDLTDGDSGQACRAVIRWTPNLNHKIFGSHTKVSELETMDEEKSEATSMDIEDTSDYHLLLSPAEGVPSQWVQPHCMFPQPPPNATTPLVWYQ